MPRGRTIRTPCKGRKRRSLCKTAKKSCTWASGPKRSFCRKRRPTTRKMVGGNPDIADSKEKYVNILSRLYDKFNNEKGTVLIKHTWDPKIGRVDETVGRYHFPKDTQNFNDYIDRVKNHLSETLFDRHIYTITSTYL